LFNSHRLKIREENVDSFRDFWSLNWREVRFLDGCERRGVNRERVTTSRGHIFKGKEDERISFKAGVFISVREIRGIDKKWDQF
jgi:hypothetical protein